MSGITEKKVNSSMKFENLKIVSDLTLSFNRNSLLSKDFISYFNRDNLKSCIKVLYFKAEDAKGNKYSIFYTGDDLKEYYSTLTTKGKLSVIGDCIEHNNEIIVYAEILNFTKYSDKKLDAMNIILNNQKCKNCNNSLDGFTFNQNNYDMEIYEEMDRHVLELEFECPYCKQKNYKTVLSNFIISEKNRKGNFFYDKY